MPITTKKIAELAGVSRGTVDRALNDRPGVSEDNRRKVKELAESLGYVPNRAGKALSTAKRALTVGLVLNCVDNPFYDEVIAGIEACKAAYPDFNLAFRYQRLKGYSPLEQLDALKKLEDAGIILITPLNEPEVAQKINLLVEKGVTVITLNNDVEDCSRLLYVGCDYVGSGRTAAGLLGLLTGGQGTVGIVTGSLRMLGHRQRVEGFREILARDYPGLRDVWLLETNDDDLRAYNGVTHMLEKESAVTALYFGVGGIPGGIRAVTERCGDSMPIIVTCDDIDPTKELVRQGVVMATVCQEPYRQGYEALRLALEYRITGKKPEQEVWYTKNVIKIVHNLE